MSNTDERLAGGPAVKSSEGRGTFLRRATWIILLVLGILTLAQGLCSGAALGFALFIMNQLARDFGVSLAHYAPAIARQTPAILWILLGIWILGPLAVGSVEIVCSLKLRRGSPAAALVAAAAVGLQIAVLLWIAAGTWMNRGETGDEAGSVENTIVGIVFCLAIAAALGGLEWMLLRLLRQLRRTAASRKEAS